MDVGWTSKCVYNSNSVDSDADYVIIRSAFWDRFVRGLMLETKKINKVTDHKRILAIVAGHHCITFSLDWWSFKFRTRILCVVVVAIVAKFLYLFDRATSDH